MKLIILLFFCLSTLISASKLKSQAKSLDTMDLSSQINAQSLFENLEEQTPTTASTATPAATATTTAAATPAAASTTAAAGNASVTAVIKEGWLQLSSLQTLSAKKFPFIPLGKNNWARIETVNKVLNNTIQDLSKAGQTTSFRKNQHYKIDATVPSDNSFYFRVSGLNVYYTETKTDMIVLGAIAVDNIVSTNPSKLGDNCFRVRNKQGDKWDLCAASSTDRTSWMCAVSQALGTPCDNGTTQAGPLVINEKNIVKEPIILIPLPSPVCNEDWNYGSHGNNWNCKCSEGFEQSPINVERRCTSNINETASFQWNKVSIANLALFYEDNMMKIKCKFEDKSLCTDTVFGRIIDSDFAEYSCSEIRFHTPGEHTIEERRFDMEVQLIYQPTSEGDYKKKAAIAFLGVQGPGKNNKFLDPIDFMNLPNMYQLKIDVNTTMNDADTFDPEELFKDVDDIFEYNGYWNYWRYGGSLTSPPCDEHTRWFVVEKPIHVGYTALNMVKDVLALPSFQAVQADGTSKNVANLNSPANPTGNNRDPMPIRDRGILYYDARASNCAPQPVRKPVHGVGHYEKVPRKTETFLWVKGEKPSGIDGALVVPEWEAKGLESPEEQRNNDINNIAANNE